MGATELLHGLDSTLAGRREVAEPEEGVSLEAGIQERLLRECIA